MRGLLLIDPVVVPPAAPVQKPSPRFTIPRRVLIVGATIATAALTVFGGYQLYRIYSTRAYFAAALERADVAHDGSLQEMERAYARELARRNPIFGLDGAPLDLFSTALERLTHTVHALRTMQSAKDDQALVDTLYPLDFLRSLLETETARRAFIASGSGADQAAYARALTQAIKTGSQDAASLSSSLNKVYATASIQIPTLGHAITSERILQSARDTGTFMRSLEGERQRRANCVSGDIHSCRADDLALPVISVSSSTPLSDGLSEFSKDVYALMTRNTYDARPRTERFITISSSACVAGAQAPYLFAYRPEDPDAMARYVYIGDIYFTPTDAANALTLKYLRTELGISYSRLNPMSFYSCPEVGYDIGTIRAISATADFASAHPTLAPEAAAALSGAVLSQSAAEQYLSTALENVKDAREREALISLTLQLTRKSSGLAEVIEEISSVSDTDIAFVRSGVPFSLGAKDLLLGHSAFPSLFLTLHTPWSSGITSLRLKDASLLDRFLERQKSYSELRSTVPRSKLEHDIRAFVEFETTP